MRAAQTSDQHGCYTVSYQVESTFLQGECCAPVRQELQAYKVKKEIKMFRNRFLLIFGVLSLLLVALAVVPSIDVSRPVLIPVTGVSEYPIITNVTAT